MSGGTIHVHLTSLPHEEEANVVRHLANFARSGAGDEADVELKEESILKLGSQLAANKQTEELRKMIEATRPFLLSLGKAKAAKLVRDLVDLCLMIEDESGDIKVQLCNECIQWATEQNRTFLRQTLQARLVRLFNELKRFTSAISLASELIRELKKIDDKDVLVEVQLEESKAYYNLRNIMHARSSLTGARTTANTIYINAKLQAALDLQAGILHAADEKDFKTAFSYFYEAFEGYHSVNEKRLATIALKYMLLAKVMLDSPEEVSSILTSKNALEYSGSDIDAMKAVAEAAKKRSLADFKQAFGFYCDELQMDSVICKHFNSLSERMLEKDLCRLIEPYSVVELRHLAKVINLDRTMVERKLAQMILDQKFSGSLNQGDGLLIIYGPEESTSVYETTISTIAAMGEVVDALYERAKKLH